MDIIKVLVKYGDFRRLWLSSLLSETGSAFSLVALPLYVIHQSHSYMVAGILTAVGFIGTVVMRIPGGFIGDRWPRRRILMASAAGGMLAMLAVAASVAWHPAFQYWLIGVAWTINGFIGSTAAVVQSSAVARTLPDEDAQRGFAAWQAQYAATTVVGPLLGGLTFTISHTLPFTIDAVSFLFELIVLSRIRQSLGEGQPIRATTKEAFRGVATVVRDRFLVVYAVTNGVINVASQGMLYGMVFWMTRLGGMAVGTSFVVLAVGSLIGSAISPRLRSRRYHLLLMTCVGAYALVGLFGYLASTPWAAVVGLSAAALISQPPSVVLTSHIMTTVPDALRGRVQGALFLIGSALYPFGAFVTGAIASSWSINGSFAVWGVFCCLPLLASLIPSWRLPSEGFLYLPLTEGT